MKKLFFIAITILLMVNCSSDDNVINNPNLPDYSFDTGNIINTSLPLYNSLKFPGNYITLPPPYGINGLVLYYAGADMYSVFELSDPNHPITTCSKLTINGIIATCNCDDDNSYNILNGLPETGTTGGYTLKPYYVSVSGSIIRVYNN
ncbi:hypothetical protein [Formosa sp. PL04]|uniref:hypothetical protein n=1 Tax=Formosa sp. PL04 TaxID=3081755 RepID=UPI002982057A|nr:hypothetical protein [Formosa sp. PL04]MDW5287258.1 hypothetical protein [Formosa sp. PL04]